MATALPAPPDWAVPGTIIRDLPHWTYHQARGLISKSALDEVDRSLAHYLHWLLGAADEEPTEAFIVGDAFHALVLEPVRFQRDYIELPDFGDMRSSKNRGIRDEWLATDAAGRKALTPKHWYTIHKMRDAVYAHPAARRLLADGDRMSEVTGTWTDPETELRCKARADLICPRFDCYADLKSAANAHPNAWRRQAGELRYHVQDALYSRVFDACGGPAGHFIFIVAEKEPPYAVGCYQLDETALLAGEQAYMKGLRLIREALEKDHWPAYGDSVTELSLPPWYTDRYLNDEDSTP